MADFVDLWIYLSSTPLFGLTATLAVYLLVQAVYRRLSQAPWANPVLWSIVILGTGLAIFNVPYPTYFSGAQFIHFLLGPGVVALGWPLFVRRREVRARWRRLLCAALVGGGVASLSAVALGWALGLPREILLSLASKSVTAPVAMGIAQEIGGIPALAAVFAVLSGLVGAATGRYLFDLLGVPRDDRGWQARGYAIGTAAHGIGAAHAMVINPRAGAFAGLALGLQVLVASLLIPLFYRLAMAWGIF